MVQFRSTFVYSPPPSSDSSQQLFLQLLLSVASSTYPSCWMYTFIFSFISIQYHQGSQLNLVQMKNKKKKKPRSTSKLTSGLDSDGKKSSGKIALKKYFNFGGQCGPV